MASATITITDDEGSDSEITVALDFGAAVNPQSNAHKVANYLVHTVLTNSKNFTDITDSNNGDT